MMCCDWRKKKTKKKTANLPKRRINIVFSERTVGHSITIQMKMALYSPTFLLSFSFRIICIRLRAGCVLLCEYIVFSACLFSCCFGVRIRFKINFFLFFRFSFFHSNITTKTKTLIGRIIGCKRHQIGRIRVQGTKLKGDGQAGQRCGIPL